MNRKEFSPDNFRRFLERPDMKGVKDYSDYAKSLNEEMYEHKTRILKTTTPEVSETICSKTGNNFFNSRKKLRGTRFSVNQADFNPDEAELKPKLLENRVINQKDFFSLSNGFQKVFANDYQDKVMVLPIAGYSGHQRGDKAQNYYGRTFRDAAIQSKKLERQLHKVR